MKKLLFLFCLIFMLSNTFSVASVKTDTKIEKFDVKSFIKTAAKVSNKTKVFLLDEFVISKVVSNERQKNSQALEFNKEMITEIQDVDIFKPDVGWRNYLREQTFKNNQLDKILCPNPR